MQPNKQDLENLKSQVKESFLQIVKQRCIERLLRDNDDRLQKYYATVSHELAESIAKEFPL